MHENPLVSIITPLYNAEDYSSDTSKSVFAQNYPDWEYIIVNDGSTDNGPQIAADHAGNDPRVKILQLNGNAGAGVSRNAGISAAKGRYIAFLDSDDIWMPQKLSRQLDYMNETKAVFSFTDYRQITESGEPTDRVIRCRNRLTYRRQLKTNYVGCSTAIYDTDYYGKRYFPEIRKRQDFGLWLDLLKDGTTGYGLSEVLTEYRVRNTGLSGRKIELIKHNWRLYREVLGFSAIRSLYYLVWNIAIKVLGRR